MRPAAALLIALTCAFARPTRAQDTIRTVSARSRFVTITDGLHVKKNYWYVMPEKAVDVYYVEIPEQPHTVTFTTDMDSISVPVTYGTQYEFLIRLDNGVECRTQIRAAYRDVLSHQRTGVVPPDGVDLIPFTLGDNDKIYVKGRVNGGPVLDFQFDLGAGGSIIKKSSIPRANMQFDGSATLRNSDGTHVVPSSSKNRVEIAGMRWDAVPFLVADNMTRREDGLIGNTFFRDKVIEIDYDRMVIAIHDTLPVLTPGWTKEEMILDGGATPFIRGTLSIDDTVRTGWLLLDTGAYTSIFNTDRLSPRSKVAREFRRMLGPLGGRPQGPTVSIAGQSLTGINYSARRYDGDATTLGLLGNDVLKRFNQILDNRNGVAYFRVNGRLEESFRNPERYLAWTAALAGAAGIGAIVWRVLR